ncbi:hypothetical protein ASG92_24645 [Arthrobacter sp. Soil736]|nr:hypothetical protein ASG92_24645 [Arthrobacter sp. Soil736]
MAYWRPNWDVHLPWLRHRPVTGELYPERRLDATQKVVQLTGEFDRQNWDGLAQTLQFAHNRTEYAYQIRGTDLGVSFPHRDRTYFLFGDTWRVNQPPEWINLDAVAYTKDRYAGDGLDLVFLPKPPHISDNIAQREFEVPLDGVSVGDAMYVFFSTGHYRVANYDLMGRSILTRSNDEGHEFTYLRTFSSGRFINVSIERGRIEPRVADAARIPGINDVLWIWGSGRYRSSSVYLAVVPFEDLAGPEFRVRYFSGNGRAQRWSANEDDATSLFCAGDVGEISVRWNPQLERYLAMFNTGNPRGIVMHSARTPWGPWSSRPIMVFDPNDGYGHFMHKPDENGQLFDRVQDDMFDPGHLRNGDPGGEYGPYQVSNYSVGTVDGGAQVYFTMSTWNPYQVVLMSTLVRSDAVDP